MAIVAAKLSVAAQDNKGLSADLDKEFWTLIRSHPDCTVQTAVVSVMTMPNSLLDKNDPANVQKNH